MRILLRKGDTGRKSETEKVNVVVLFRCAGRDVGSE